MYFDCRITFQRAFLNNPIIFVKDIENYLEGVKGGT